MRYATLAVLTLLLALLCTPFLGAQQPPAPAQVSAGSAAPPSSALT